MTSGEREEEEGEEREEEERGSPRLGEQRGKIGGAEGAKVEPRGGEIQERTPGKCENRLRFLLYCSKKF